MKTNNDYITDKNFLRKYWKWSLENRTWFGLVVFLGFSLITVFNVNNPDFQPGVWWFFAFFFIITLVFVWQVRKQWREHLGRCIDLRGGYILVRITGAEEGMWYRDMKGLSIKVKELTDEYYSGERGAVRKADVVVIETD